MKILLSYSKRHYNPLLLQEEHRYWGSSAQVLACALYEILSLYGDVEYVDQTEFESISGKEYELYIGIVGNYQQFSKRIKAKRRVLFAVNNHPVKQYELLHEIVGSLKREVGELHISENHLANFSNILNSVDYVMGVGNNFTMQSFLDAGFPLRKCKFFNYGIQEKILPVAKNNTGPIIFSYIVSDIGLRKGFDIIHELFTDTSIQHIDFVLHIAGGISNQQYSSKLDDILDKLKGKAHFYGWLQHSSTEYIRLMSETDIMLCPSLEEGQVGTLVEAMAHGIIPMGTDRCGIDFFPLGTLEAKLTSVNNRKIIYDVLHMPREEITRLKNKTIEYYNYFHSSFKLNLEESIKSILRNEDLYPNISIILPIFNKQETIIGLLLKLHACCLAYKNVEVHIIFDGCKDKTEEKVRKFYDKRNSYPVTYEVTPDIFEVKTNNIGLKKSTGKYCIIIQDDTFINDPTLFIEAIVFLEKTPAVAILGCLAGVNFYPRGTSNLIGNGQIQISQDEVYWRQDAATDPNLKKYFFEVDAVMRGPLIIRRSFLLEHGYLDEVYAPLYNDDMDICFRAKQKGYKVFAMIGNVSNASLTMAAYSPEKWERFKKILKRNTNIFYSRYTPSTAKNYLRICRTPLNMRFHRLEFIRCLLQTRIIFFKELLRRKIKSKKEEIKRIFKNFLYRLFPVADPVHSGQIRLQWLEKTLATVPHGARIFDAGTGQLILKQYCSHLDYVSQGFAQYDGKGDSRGIQSKTWDQTRLDIISNICAIPEPDMSFDAVLCTEIFEHLPDPPAALKEFNRLLKSGGELILTAPFCSCTNSSPFFFNTGFSPCWYKKHLTDAGFSITELTPNGNFHSFMLQELHRTPQIVSKYTNIKMSWLDKIALHISKSFFSKVLKEDKNSAEFLCFGYHVRAKKL